MISRYRLDPEIAAVLEPMAASAAEAPPIERGIPIERVPAAIAKLTTRSATRPSRSSSSTRRRAACSRTSIEPRTIDYGFLADLRVS